MSTCGSADEDTVCPDTARSSSPADAKLERAIATARIIFCTRLPSNDHRPQNFDARLRRNVEGNEAWLIASDRETEETGRRNFAFQTNNYSVPFSAPFLPCKI